MANEIDKIRDKIHDERDALIEENIHLKKQLANVREQLTVLEERFATEVRETRRLRGAVNTWRNRAQGR